MSFKAVSGLIYRGDLEAFEGYVTIENGVIKEIGRGEPPIKPIATGTVLPSFVNAHSHLGDSAIDVDPEKYTLDELVGPGGLKERGLKKLTKKDLVKGMKISLSKGYNEGTTHTLDFREGGVKGIKALKKASRETGVETVIYGRPNQPTEEEIKEVVSEGDGVGLSSVCDYSDEKLSLLQRELSDVPTALHAGESLENQEKSIERYSDSEVIRSLEFNPKHLVHLTNPVDGDIDALVDADTPVVVCPRSNKITRSGKPPIQELLDHGLTVALGTDNAMLCSPSVLDEARHIYSEYELAPETVIRMACLYGGKIIGVDNRIVEGNRANIMVIEEVSMGIKALLDGCASIATVVSGLDVIENV